MWFQWKTIEEERVIRGTTNTISFIVKDVVTGEVSSIDRQSHEPSEIVDYTHVQHLPPGAVLFTTAAGNGIIRMQIYMCKLEKEIHFVQVTLHTGASSTSAM